MDFQNELFFLYFFYLAGLHTVRITEVSLPEAGKLLVPTV